MDINITGGEISQKEMDAYIDRGRSKYSGRNLASIEIHIDGDYAEIIYYPQAVPFQRIRRITGYLVGTTEKFNDAKKAEERDRVKHSVNCSMEQIV